MRFGIEHQGPEVVANWAYTIEPTSLPGGERRLLAENSANRIRRETVHAGRSTGPVKETRRRMTCLLGYPPGGGLSVNLPADWFDLSHLLCVEFHDFRDDRVPPSTLDANDVRITIDGELYHAAQVPLTEANSAIPARMPRSGAQVFGPWEWRAILINPALPNLNDCPASILIQGRGWEPETSLAVAEVEPYIAGRSDLLKVMRERSSSSGNGGVTDVE